jgi:hypothetical protein
MIRIHDIEAAIRKLPPRELAQFRTWFHEFDAQNWDKQFEQDVAAGRLDALAAEAIDDLHKGKCKDL